jgi:hypothetical protein
MLNNLFASIGYAQAVRASGYILLGCLIAANLLIKTRIPGRKKRPAHMQFPAPDMKAIVTHKAYLLTILSGFLIMSGSSLCCCESGAYLRHPGGGSSTRCSTYKVLAPYLSAHGCLLLRSLRAVPWDQPVYFLLFAFDLECGVRSRPYSAELYR